MTPSTKHTPETPTTPPDREREAAIAILEAIFVPIGKIFGEAFTADDKQISLIKPFIASHVESVAGPLRAEVERLKALADYNQSLCSKAYKRAEEAEEEIEKLRSCLKKALIAAELPELIELLKNEHH